MANAKSSVTHLMFPSELVQSVQALFVRRVFRCWNYKSLEANRQSWFKIIAASFLTIFLPLATFAECPDIDGLKDTNCDGELVIGAFGDSITYGKNDPLKLGYVGRLTRYFPSATIRNYGKSGEDTGYGRLRAMKLFRRLTSLDYLIVLEGVNDFFVPHHSTARTKSNLYWIAQYGAHTGAITLLGSLTPVRRGYQSNWPISVNRAIRRQIDIDFFSLGKGIIGSDKLHPNARGYDKMAIMVANKLMDLSTATPTNP